VLTTDKRRWNGCDVSCGDDEVLNARKVLTKSVPSPRIEFGENVIKYHHRIACVRTSPDHVNLGETQRQCTRPRLALTRVSSCRKIIENHHHVVTVRTKKGCSSVNFLSLFHVKQRLE
jgi:hypothetical protein